MRDLRAENADRPLRWPWLFRLLLHAYPRRFRADFGRDLARACAAMEGRAYASRPGRMAWDLLRNGLGARLDDWKLRWARLGPRSRTLIPDGESAAMDSLLNDLFYAARALRKNPGFTAIALLSLALGIGANTAVFSVTDAVLLRQLPVADPGRIVVLQLLQSPEGGLPVSHNGWMIENDEGRRQSSSFSYPDFVRLTAAAEGRAELFAFADLYDVNVRVVDEPEIAGGQLVTGNYYEVLGVAPALGRLLGPADDRPNAEPVAVLSHDFWQRRFGADPGIVGSTIHVNGVAFTIAGVSAPGFAGTLQVGSDPEVTVPLSTAAAVMRRGDRAESPAYWWLHVMGRLGPGADPEGLQARLQPALSASISAGLPDADPALIPDLQVGDGSQGMVERRGFLVDPVMTMVWVVALILLIACANLANLLLARSSTREREIAVRQSLGASRARVIRQLLTESILLSLIGGALGLLLAHWGQGLLVSLGAIDGGLSLDAGIDLRVIAFAFAVALATGLLFGTVPALRATSTELTPALRDAAGATTGSRRQLLVSKAVLVSQVGLSVVLLVMAGLFLRSLANLADSIEGFDPEGVLLFSVDPRMNHYENAETQTLYADALRRLRTIPEIEEASIGGLTPVGRRWSTSSIGVDGYEPSEDESVFTVINVVGDRYVEALDIPGVAGRSLDTDDLAGARDVALVNREFTRRYLEGRNPIGARFGFGDDPPEIEIVGVVGDLPYQQASDENHPTVYLPYTRSQSLGRMTFVLETRGEPSRVMSAARDVLRELDPLLPLMEVTTLEQQSWESLAEERQLARLAAVMGGLALLLACVGLYGILSYAVVRRTREIGVRKALGAGRTALNRLVLRELRPVALGAALGIVAAVYTTRLFESQLHELPAVDPVSVVGATLVLAAVALVAAWVPLRRAASVDPVDALRQE